VASEVIVRSLARGDVARFQAGSLPVVRVYALAVSEWLDTDSGAPGSEN
jgi:hypothetical protein